MLSAATVVLAIIAIVLVVTSGGSGSGAGNAYPAAVAQEFTTGCEAHTPPSWSQSTASGYCGAALSCVETHVSLVQLEAIDQSVAAGEDDPDEAQVELCAASALRITPGT